MINITSIMQVARGIGKSTVERMKEVGIDSIEKLASSSIEDLLIIDEIGIKTARKYIEFAQKHLQAIQAKQKIYSIINKKNTSNGSSSKDIIPDQNLLDNTNSPRVPISSIQKLASSSMEDISRLESIGVPDAKRYVDIAKKYLESMRTKEKTASSVSRTENIQQKQLLGFVKFDQKSRANTLLTEISPANKRNIPLKKAQLIQKPMNKLVLDIKPLQKPSQIKEIKPTQKEMKKQTELKSFFPPETTQRIRFLHYNIKKLEEALARNEKISFSELNYIIEYIKILNVNYKTQSQIKIFKELEISPSFYDPIAKKDIKIWDLIFECSRVLWISAQAYSFLSNRFEEQNLMENAIVAMVECSKMYKTAAYFSAACTRQEDKGIALSVENLEMNSEESRILAQNLATISEETKGNFSMASKLYAGLSALTKRLAFLRKYSIKKENQFKAQYNYDIGRACHLKAKSLIKLSPEGDNEEEIENLQKKANYYYMKAEEAWETMLNKSEDISASERKSIKGNLSIVNENIIENDVGVVNDEEAAEIQDPDPLIIIPENLAPFIPRTTNFLTKYKQSDLDFKAYLRYKNLMSDVLINFDRIEELRNSKAGIGRTLKQLKILYDNNDIDINSFTELFEKYSIKLEAIENAIQNLKKPRKLDTKKEPKKVLKSIL
ncbi:MAG: helix-hairpin-helix domain-containing protein [Candidatus Thorarchaeota archaeon]